MTSAYDILGLGCVAVDDLLYADAYPVADAKVQIRRRERQCGGVTATALVAAARLGSRCAYGGVLGEDELSLAVVENFHKEGVDLTHLRRRKGARPIHAIVIVDESRRSRTIFYDLEGASGALPDWPPAEVIRAARVLFVDHFGVEGMLRAAGIARAAGIPVVADFETDEGPGFAELLAQVDHLIVSREFAERHTEASSPSNAVDRLWNADRKAVMVTCGSEGCWWRAEPGPDEVRHQPAFSVDVVDTTGCGDVFHGAYASALARGLAMEDRVRIATAAAALKATRRGGQAGLPTRFAVEALLQGHS